MKYGLVYLAITLGFSGLGKQKADQHNLDFNSLIAVFMTNPFNHTNIAETYEKKWRN